MLVGAPASRCRLCAILTRPQLYVKYYELFSRSATSPRFCCVPFVYWSQATVWGGRPFTRGSDYDTRPAKLSATVRCDCHWAATVQTSMTPWFASCHSRTARMHRQSIEARGCRHSRAATGRGTVLTDRRHPSTTTRDTPASQRLPNAACTAPQAIPCAPAQSPCCRGNERQQRPA